MSADRLVQRALLWTLAWIERYRYLKFGIVGASGMVVNMVVLYLAQEYLFAAITDPKQRLYPSLALAIALATVNNFTWNRLWTWADRVQAANAHQQQQQAHLPLAVMVGQLSRYALASWLGIALQYGLTLWLAHHLYYLLANVIAIVIASVSNFLANDYWTFRRSAPK